MAADPAIDMPTTRTGGEAIPLTASAAAELCASTDVFVFDLDGVVWLNKTVVPHAAETLAALRAAGKRVLFVSNNSTLSRQAYLKKFADFGIAVAKEEIFPAAYACAQYLLSVGFRGKAYVVGTAGISDELTEAGIPWIGGPNEVSRPRSELLVAKRDPEVAAVVVGGDPNLFYSKIATAQLYLLNRPETLFVASNTDCTYPTEANTLPGAGMVVAAVETCSMRKAIVVGKPSQFLLDRALAHLGVPRERVCMVGDRLDTDILFGLRGGLQTLLVLTGITTRDELQADANMIMPHYVADSIAGLLPGVAAATESR